MSRPQPTMIRKAKKGIITGGRSARGKSVKPTSFERRLMLPITLPRTGMPFGPTQLALG
jgi:hypothetical protein